MVSDAIPQRHPGQPGPAAVSAGSCPGYVLGTFGPDHPRSLRRVGVECDVVLNDKLRTVLLNVPVGPSGPAPPSACPPWRPVPVQRNLDTGLPLVLLAPTVSLQVALYAKTFALMSDLSALDAEYVLVEFLENRMDRPAITKPLTHPRTPSDVGGEIDIPWPSDSVPHPASLSGHVRVVPHAGTKVGIDDSGNWFVDSTGAPQDKSGLPAPPTGPFGSGTINLASSATVTLRWGNGNTVLKISNVGGALKVDIGSEAAGQQVILGTSFKAFFDLILSAVKGHEHPVVGGGGGTAGPSPALSGISSMPGSTLSTRVKLTE